MAGSENAQYGFFMVDGPFGEPQWILMDDVEGVSASSDGRAAIHMKSGTVFYTETSTDEILARINEARG